MSLPVVFRRVARNEFDDAIDQYNRDRPGRGTRLTAAVQDVLDRIATLPELYAEVADGVREAPVSGFPYAVYYRVETTQIVVVAVFHTSRDPAIWQGRS